MTTIFELRLSDCKVNKLVALRKPRAHNLVWIFDEGYFITWGQLSKDLPRITAFNKAFNILPALSKEIVDTSGSDSGDAKTPAKKLSVFQKKQVRLKNLTRFSPPWRFPMWYIFLTFKFVLLPNMAMARFLLRMCASNEVSSLGWCIDM